MLTDAVTSTIARVAMPLVVSAELGPAGGSGRHVSGSRFVRCRERGREEFAIKCSIWSREPHPYLCANEWIAGLLALQCGLPTLAMVVVQHQQCLAVGWQRIPLAMWATVATHRGVLDDAVNADILYEMAAFDALVRNCDRSAKKITARRTDPRRTRYALFLYDHDRALMPPGVTPATVSEFPALDDAAYWIPEPAVRQRLTDRRRLEQAVGVVRAACSLTVIKSIVESTPSAWLAATERQPVIAFIADRSARLDAIVDEKRRVVLPHLS